MGNPAPSKKAVGIVSKPNKPQVADILPRLTQWLRSCGHDYVVDPETAAHTTDARTVSREEMGKLDLAFVIVLGGDGTLLSAARAVARTGIPIVGVNLGALGFLAEVPLDELYPTLDSIEKGAVSFNVRSMVHCEVRRRDS